MQQKKVNISPDIFNSTFIYLWVGKNTFQINKLNLKIKFIKYTL